jgi:hypothetical protein
MWSSRRQGTDAAGPSDDPAMRPIDIMRGDRQFPADNQSKASRQYVKFSAVPKSPPRCGRLSLLSNCTAQPDVAGRHLGPVRQVVVGASLSYGSTNFSNQPARWAQRPGTSPGRRPIMRVIVSILRSMWVRSTSSGELVVDQCSP